MMNQVVVNTLPQTAPISDMRNRQNVLLRMAEKGPVVLMSRSRPAAVLLSPAQWNAIADALAQHEHDVALAEGSNRSTKDSGPTRDALAEIAALAQPLGPADLSVNFDIYTKQVLVDDSAD